MSDNTPTDDEREALLRDLYTLRSNTGGPVLRRIEIVDRALAALSRSEVPEPSVEAEFAPGECDGSGTCSASMHIHGCYTSHRADQCDAPEEYGHLPSELQGEPSDAQIETAWRTYEDIPPETFVMGPSIGKARERMRAALRAAGVAK